MSLKFSEVIFLLHASELESILSISVSSLSEDEGPLPFFHLPSIVSAKVQSVILSLNCIEQTPSCPSTYSWRDGANIPCSTTDEVALQPGIITARRINKEIMVLISTFILKLSAGIRVRLHSGLIFFSAYPVYRFRPSLSGNNYPIV